MVFANEKFSFLYFTLHCFQQAIGVQQAEWPPTGADNQLVSQETAVDVYFKEGHKDIEENTRNNIKILISSILG